MTMKKTGFVFLKDNIMCPICLEVFRNPVTTACGHNFCIDCLQDYWDHQVLIGECPYCPQCREPFSSRPQLRKNITLGEIAMKFVREEAQVSRKPASSRDVPCDFCATRKLKAVKSCLQCMAALCDNHIRSHYEDKTFKNHQLVDPLSDLKASICLKHRRLLELFCKREGTFICQICIREEHKNHEAVSLKDERAKAQLLQCDSMVNFFQSYCKENLEIARESTSLGISWSSNAILWPAFHRVVSEDLYIPRYMTSQVEVRQIHANVGNQIFMLVADSQKHRGRVNYLENVVKAARDEVNRAFADMLKEVKRQQTKVMDFIDQEERAALVGMGNSIQHRQDQLANLRRQNLWLATLIDESSDYQFLQDFPKTKKMSGCTEALIGLKCEEPTSFVGLKQTLTDLKSQISMIGLCFINKVLQKGITMVPYEVIPALTDRRSLLKCRWYTDICFLTITPAKLLAQKQATL